MYENFREPELEELIEQDASDEWRSLCKELGMEGQITTLVPNLENIGNPIPYMAINLRWLKIFKTLCPTKIEYKKYSKSTIPLEALQEISLCVSKGYFNKIEIWWDDADKDPFIVGIVTGKYSSDTKHFLIARFGDELLPLEILESKAIEKMVNVITENVQKLGSNIRGAVNEYLRDNTDVSISLSSVHGSLFY